MALNKFISTQGYKSDSPDKNNPYNIIPSGRITMNNVPHPVYGIDNLGNSIYMQPGGEYQFPGNQVFEVPMHMMPDGTMMPNSEHPGYEEMELTDEEIAQYKRGGYVVEMQDGGQMYQDSLTNYLTAKKNFEKYHNGQSYDSLLKEELTWKAKPGVRQEKNKIGFVGDIDILYNDRGMNIPVSIPVYKKPTKPPVSKLDQNKSDSLDVYNTGKIASDIFNKGIPRGDRDTSKKYSDAYYQYQKAISKFGVHNAKLKEHEGYKPKTEKPKVAGGDKPLIDSNKVSGPDPRNIKKQIEVIPKTKPVDQRTIIDYKQIWDPINYKWIQEPIYEILPTPKNKTPYIIQDGGEIQELTDAEIASMRAQGYRIDIL